MMRNNLKRSFTAVLPILLALAIGIATPQARADEWNKATKMTFTEDVQVPGKILPAGTYWFRLLDSDNDRHIVQVFDSKNRHLITTVIAIPNMQMEPKNHTRVNFEERHLGQPQAIKAWFYPGEKVGQEFVYPKGESLSASATTVATTGTQVAETIPAAATPVPEMAAPVTPAPVTTDETQNVQETPATPTPTPTPDEPMKTQDQTPAPVTPDVTPQPADQDKPADTTPDTLPKTGSDFPLIATFGVFALGIGTALGALRRRTS